MERNARPRYRARAPAGFHVLITGRDEARRTNGEENQIETLPIMSDALSGFRRNEHHRLRPHFRRRLFTDFDAPLTFQNQIPLRDPAQAMPTGRHAGQYRTQTTAHPVHPGAVT